MAARQASNRPALTDLDKTRRGIRLTSNLGGKDNAGRHGQETADQPDQAESSDKSDSPTGTDRAQEGQPSSGSTAGENDNNGGQPRCRRQ